MRPPFQITPKVNHLVADIAALLGQLEVTTLSIPSPKLRRKNKIRTIKSTLAIEGHTFTEEQITGVLEDKRVLGTVKEIQAVKNAIELYDQMDHFKSIKEKDFLSAHQVLMKGLVSGAGKYRSKNVGVLKGTKVKHLAPKPMLVPELMGNVFNWIKKESELHFLILSSIVHYEIEFIHPFEDGNGRIGRFWQALILKEYNEFFQYIPIESLIEKNQKGYYASLEKSDQSGDSTSFVEFMLKVIYLALEEMLSETTGVVNTSKDRLEKARSYFNNKLFSRKNYMDLFKNISSATASRDIKKAVEEKNLKKTGKKNQTRYRF